MHFLLDYGQLFLRVTVTGSWFVARDSITNKKLEKFP